MISATLRYNKDFDRITARLENNMFEANRKATRETAEKVVDYIRDNWSDAPSQAGNPPAIRDGHLDKGISVEKQGRISGRFGGKFEAVHFIAFDTSKSKRGQYALAVEDGNSITNAEPRPFLEPALEKFADEYEDILLDKLNLRIIK